MISEFCLSVPYGLYVNADIPNVFLKDRTDDELRVMLEYGILDTSFDILTIYSDVKIYFSTLENMVKFQLAYL